MGIFLGFFIIGFTTYYTYTGISCFLVGIIFIIIGSGIVGSTKSLKILLLKKHFSECPFCHSVDSLILKPLGEAEADYAICKKCQAKWHIYYSSNDISWAKLVSPNVKGDGTAFLNIPREMEFWKKLSEVKYRPQKMVKHNEVAEISLNKDGTISVKCPYCSAPTPLYLKKSKVTCEYCGKRYIIPKDFLDLIK
ncbi:MAG: hypothetical protein QXS37_06085 [Candidatus Aenigmatarchaeota archaeon]